MTNMEVLRQMIKPTVQINVTQYYIGYTTINKGRTQITRRESTHDQPERMLKIAKPSHLEFKHLAGVDR